MPDTKEAIKWSAKWSVEKYKGDLPTEKDREGIKPYEVLEGAGNLLLNAGIDELWDLITGVGGTEYNNANARIGVGNSNTAAVATQTALIGGSTELKGMEATYPLSTSQAITFRASFGSSEGNFAWQEWVVDNGSGAAVCLNRKVTSLGTKSSGTTWVFTVTITLS